ncbi:MAG: ABC transporter permease subunit [Candidatus Undinarchaeales archaeon]|jgi:molybdate transport system permease protein|nr:ABC transporter permease subunit [Candidatus Undinarchaeales archaeon]MDP7494614.1 ABC transporter permease subunit [Candidatus Undinarchaeales archaeon]
MGKDAGIGQDRFMLSAYLILGFLTLYMAMLIGSLLTHTDLPTIMGTLLSAEVLYALKLSLFTASVSTALCIAVAIPAAYILSRSDFRGKAFVDSLLDLPIVVPPVALGAMLLLFFSTSLGKGIEAGTLALMFERPGIVVAQFTVITGLALRLLKNTFDLIDPGFEDLARTLGYTRFQAFAHVTLPLAQRGIFASIVLVWARAFGEYGATITFAGATTMKTETLPVAIYLNLATANVAATISIVLILIAVGFGVLACLRLVGKEARTL